MLYAVVIRHLPANCMDSLHCVEHSSTPHHSINVFYLLNFYTSHLVTCHYFGQVTPMPLTHRRKSPQSNPQRTPLVVNGSQKEINAGHNIYHGERMSREASHFTFLKVSDGGRIILRVIGTRHLASSPLRRSKPGHAQVQNCSLGGCRRRNVDGHSWHRWSQSDPLNRVTHVVIIFIAPIITQLAGWKISLCYRWGRNRIQRQTKTRKGEKAMYKKESTPAISEHQGQHLLLPLCHQVLSVAPNYLEPLRKIRC